MGGIKARQVSSSGRWAVGSKGLQIQIQSDVYFQIEIQVFFWNTEGKSAFVLKHNPAAQSSSRVKTQCNMNSGKIVFANILLLTQTAVLRLQNKVEKCIQKFTRCKSSWNQSQAIFFQNWGRLKFSVARVGKW